MTYRSIARNAIATLQTPSALSSSQGANAAALATAGAKPESRDNIRARESRFDSFLQALMQFAERLQRKDDYLHGIEARVQSGANLLPDLTNIVTSFLLTKASTPVPGDAVWDEKTFVQEFYSHTSQYVLLRRTHHVVVTKYLRDLMDLAKARGVVRSA